MKTASRSQHERSNFMKNGKLTVAIVGMGFGSCFLPIYLKHPDVEHVIMVDTNPDQLKALADMYLLDESYYTTDFEAVLQNPDVDAVHLVIPPALHAPMSVQVLNAGKHCACTIPMGMSMKELEDVIKARKASGKHYMFMETSVYTREYLYVKELYESGAMGKLQYMRCAHYQDMEGWPSYWDGFPPLAHPTHAIGPCFALAGQRPVSVFGRGSGKVRPELEKQYGCPFAFESALVALEDGETTVEMERFLYHVARGYSECFNIYGENKSFEWDQLNGDKHQYGRTKRMGEELVEKHVTNYYIIRTAWVFGNYGKNFVFTMQNLAKTHKTLTVVNDQHGRPTWTRTLAEFLTYLAENRKDYGYYHLSNDAEEDTTWYDFAVEILKDTDVEVKPVDSSQFPAKAKRPLNSTMSLAKAKATGFVIPTWQDALKEFCKQEVK